MKLLPSALRENSPLSKGGGPKKDRGSPASTKKAGFPAETNSHRRREIVVAVQPALFCETLCHRLAREPDFVIAGRACNEDQIVELLAKESPQVLVFDYEGLGPNGEGTVGRLRRSTPGTRILVLASRSGDEIVERVLRALGLQERTHPKS